MHVTVQTAASSVNPSPQAYTHIKNRQEAVQTIPAGSVLDVATAPQYTSVVPYCLVCLCAGFDNIEPLIGYDNNVLNKYFNEYLPRAVSERKAQL